LSMRVLPSTLTRRCIRMVVTSLGQGHMAVAVAGVSAAASRGEKRLCHPALALLPSEGILKREAGALRRECALPRALDDST